MTVLATVSDWAFRISATWRRTAESIIETGRILTEAKAALSHGEWGETVALLPFDDRTTQRLMAIAGDDRLSNPAILPLLPGQWTKLHKLHKLDDEELERALKDNAPINGARTIMGSRKEPDDSLDYFPTPPWATRALMERVICRFGSYEPDQLSAWEPACGEGHMAEVLKEYFGEVSATDIHDYGYGFGGGNFLGEWNSDHGCAFADADWIITNPPFGDKTEAFVLRALDLARIGVAMFVRLQWLESVGRYENVFRDYPPTVIAFFAERVNLCKGRWDPDGTTATAYIWLVWIRDRAPRAPIWIPPGQREQLTKPDDRERFTAHPVKSKEPARDQPSHRNGEGEPASDPGFGAGSPHSIDQDDPLLRVPEFCRRAP